MNENKVSRRVTLKLLTAVPVVSAVLSACGSKSKPDSCNDVSALSASEKAVRDALKYTDKSPDPAKVCTGCLQWEPNADPAQCGGCKVVKGPIHPDGYCSSWAAKPA